MSAYIGVCKMTNYELEGQGSFPGRDKDFQNGCVLTINLYPGGATGTWICPLTCTNHRGLKCMELKMKTVYFSETSASTAESTRRQNSEVHSHHRVNLKSHNDMMVYTDTLTLHYCKDWRIQRTDNIWSISLPNDDPATQSGANYLDLITAVLIPALPIYRLISIGHSSFKSLQSCYKFSDLWLWVILNSDIGQKKKTPLGHLRQSQTL
jgi:hypothetical protein